MRRLAVAMAFGGVGTTMLGALMPRFQSQWALPDSEAGLLFTAQFLATVCVAAAVSRLARQFGYFRLVRFGLLLMAAGVAGLAAANWPAALAAIAVYGCGLGLIIPGANLGVSGARPVVLLNLWWCAGAVAAPILIAALPGEFLWILALGAAMAALLLGAPGGASHGKAETKRQPAQGAAPHVISALLLFLYVGTETAIAGWVAVLTLREAAAPGGVSGFWASGLWAIMPSAFWAGMLLGRLITPALLSMFKPPALILGGFAVAFAGAALLTFGHVGHGAEWNIAAGALSGFGLSPVFPLVVAQYTDVVANASGLVFSAAGLGGAALPALVGVLSQTSGSLRAGMSSVLICLVLLVFLETRFLHFGDSLRGSDRGAAISASE